MDGTEFPIPLPRYIQQGEYLPFFLGRIKKNGDKFGICIVSTSGFEPKKKNILWSSPPKGKEKQCVVGLKTKGGTKFFVDNKLEYPVQVIPWNYVTETESGWQKSAAEFFWKTDNTTIKCDPSLPLISRNNGHVIIYDSVKDVFLKGFYPNGAGRIQCSDVKFLSRKEFEKDIEKINQATPMTVAVDSMTVAVNASHQFLLLVPVQNNQHEERGVHSVLNVGKWQPLDKLFGGKPVKSSGMNEGINKDGKIALDDKGNQETADEDIRGSNKKSTIRNDKQFSGNKSSDELGREGWMPLDKVILPDSGNGKGTDSEDESSNMKHGHKLDGGDNTSASPAQVTYDTSTEDTLPGAETSTGREQNQNEQYNDGLDEDGWDKSEIKFLKDLEQYVNDCGFKYNTADLVRLHTSVKCSMCTLLVGSPGTGKSSLAELYMMATCGGTKGRGTLWQKFFVNPAWMEPADLLGYESEDKEGKRLFKCAPSGFADFIRGLATKKGIGIACFEEMNLARVEHYFSDFVQIISSGGGVVPGCKHGDEELKVESNFRLFGTCNFDESTQMLSPRFLSRCNAIELSSSYETTKELTDALLKNEEVPTVKEFSEPSQAISYNDFETWRNSASMRPVNKAVVYSFLSLLKSKDNDKSIMSGAGFDVSGRIVEDMFVYIKNRPPYARIVDDAGNSNPGLLDELERQRVALDEFLAQRVFFACRPTPGTIAGINKLAGELEKGINPIEKGDNDNAEPFKLPLSSALLKRRIADYNSIMTI